MRIWQTIRTPLISRHVHKRAYAALVLSGYYEEAGGSGRHRVQAGDVVLDEAFEAHLDRPFVDAKFSAIWQQAAEKLISSEFFFVFSSSTDVGRIFRVSRRSLHALPETLPP